MFISYAQADASAADEVVNALTSAGVDVWIDRRNIRPGDSFIAKMSEGLAGAGYVVLLLSSASLASRWVSREWMSALASHETALIPVLLERVEVPAIIRDVVYVDLVRDRRAGLAELARMFRDEGKPAYDDVRGGSVLSGCSRYELRKVANRCLSEHDFRACLSDLQISPGQIAGGSLHERLVSLIMVTDVDGMILEFARWLEVERGPCVSAQLAKLRAAGINFGPPVV